MSDKAREIKLSTQKRLFALSGNQCAEPECAKSLIARDEKSIIAKICHIEAANENGARYRAEMNDNERRHFDNLILLCDECHTIIDNKENEQKYPVALLKEWKKNHEGKRMESLSKDTSLLSIAISAIANIDLDDSDSPYENKKINTFNSKAFDIEDKIAYNNIKRNKSWIDEYSVFFTKINPLYDELEKAGSFKKKKLLRNIKLLYLKIKGRYIEDSTEPLKIIQNNADSIIEDIESELLSKIDKKTCLCCEEDISVGVSIVMVDAFMRCKILEKPIKK